MHTAPAQSRLAPPGDWIACTCCARTFLSPAAGHAQGCAADLLDDTICINAGSCFATGAVFLVVLTEVLELDNGPLCDACIVGFLQSDLIFSA